MKHAMVRTAKVQDGQQVLDWTGKLLARNAADPEVFKYPATRTLTAYNCDHNVIHMPVQTVPVLEALAINPEASVLEVAGGLKALIQTVAWECDRLGYGELWFLCRDEETIAFAEHNGFERVNMPVFRRKVGC